MYSERAKNIVNTLEIYKELHSKFIEKYIWL